MLFVKISEIATKIWSNYLDCESKISTEFVSLYRLVWRHFLRDFHGRPLSSWPTTQYVIKPRPQHLGALYVFGNLYLFLLLTYGFSLFVMYCILYSVHLHINLLYSLQQEISIIKNIWNMNVKEEKKILKPFIF